MLRTAGIDQRGAVDAGEGAYAIADLTIRYTAPARLDDDLLILSRLMETKAASCVIQQRVMRGRLLVADAMVTAVFLSPDGRPKRQPAAWVDAYRRLLGED
jgi:acyl-CoA thioester hydrolase